MKKPIIGIVCKQLKQRDNDYWHRQEIVDEIRYLIIKHGGVAVTLLPSELTFDFNQSDLGDDKILSKEEIADLCAQVDLCDGIVLQGGDYSSQYEVEIAKYAIEKDIPLIGICAGFNNLLRALGSNVYEDKDCGHSHYDINYRHLIKIEKDSKLYDFINKDEYLVNSFHTMLATKQMVEPYAYISSCSLDGLVESFELKDKKFVLGIKWHPELMLDEEYVDKMFSAFIQAC